MPATCAHPPPGPSLIDEFLDRQRDLTAVETFARRHEDSPVVEGGARLYRDLLPHRPPEADEQLAFEVDLDACTGCQACVTACHNLNGLDEHEAWRSVGLLAGGTGLPVVQHITSACHHCLDPGCLSGCPVRAYEKDPATGIVRHLDDQCIGCQYCLLKCPYDVPQYNPRRGIVRKCDMCSNRLAVGEAPACAQACPNQAIRIRVVARQEVGDRAAAGEFLPGTADPGYTRPTTRYLRRGPFPSDVHPADRDLPRPQPAHWPLVAMLVLTEASVGTFVIAWLLGAAAAPVASVALALGLLGMVASTLHLGRPLLAFRAVLGLGTSWLSREVVAFGLFAGLAAMHTAAVVWPALLPAPAARAAAVAVVLAGLAGVFCSAMIYHDTRRPWWHLRRTGPLLLLTAALLGLAVTWAVAGLGAAARPAWAGTAALLLVIGTAAKLAIAGAVLRHLRSPCSTPARRTARLLAGPLRRPALAHVALAVLGGLALPIVALTGGPLAGVALPAMALLLLTAELFERYLFFTAVDQPRMPGGL